MASKVLEVEDLPGISCPMCLDVFKNATLLSCGHTFCRECLETYDEQHHLDHIACPVCRESTNLGQNRVAGLKPNYSLKDLKDKLPEVVHSPTFCSVHSQVYNDIFCEVCKKFICLTCYFNDHRDHGVKKKEEITDEIQKKRDSLVPNGRERKSQIEKYAKEEEQQKKDSHCHLNNLEKEINDAFDKQVENLQKRKASLLKKVGDIRKNADKQFESCISIKRQLIDEMDIAIAVLTDIAIRHLDPDTYEAFHSQCTNLERSMKQDIDIETARKLKKTTESTKFHAVNENNILGDLTDGKTAPYRQHVGSIIAPNNPVQQTSSLNMVGHTQPMVQPYYQPSGQRFGYQPQRTPAMPMPMPMTPARFGYQPRTPHEVPRQYPPFTWQQILDDL